MTKKFTKILTGFTFLDLKWGGVYPGGNYLIYGSKKSGKTLLALKIIEQFAQEKLNPLLITNERIKTLEIQSGALYFDINEEISKGALHIHILGFRNCSVAYYFIYY
jgi:circadian clock protein KaiC